MATLIQYNSPEFSVVASTALDPHVRVTLDASGELVLAGATDNAIGYLTERGGEAGYAAAVRSVNAFSQVCVSQGAIAAGASVFAAGLGKVGAAGTVKLGVARTAASGADQLLGVFPGDDNT